MIDRRDVLLGGASALAGCALPAMAAPGAKETLRIPPELHILQKNIVASLPPGARPQWTQRFFDAVHTGANLSKIKDRTMVWLLTDEEGPRRHARRNGRVMASLDAVAALYGRRLDGDEPTASEWEQARSRAHQAREAADFSTAYGAALMAEMAAWSDIEFMEYARECPHAKAFYGLSLTAFHEGAGTERAAAWRAGLDWRKTDEPYYARLAAKLLDLVRDAPL
jgi:hypothetical protein